MTSFEAPLVNSVTPRRLKQAENIDVWSSNPITKSINVSNSATIKLYIYFHEKNFMEMRAKLTNSKFLKTNDVKTIIKINSMRIL